MNNLKNITFIILALAFNFQISQAQENLSDKDLVEGPVFLVVGANLPILGIFNVELSLLTKTSRLPHGNDVTTVYGVKAQTPLTEMYWKLSDINNGVVLVRHLGVDIVRIKGQNLNSMQGGQIQLQLMRVISHQKNEQDLRYLDFFVEGPASENPMQSWVKDIENTNSGTERWYKIEEVLAEYDQGIISNSKIPTIAFRHDNYSWEISTENLPKY